MKKVISMALVLAMTIVIAVPGFAAEHKSDGPAIILTNNNTGHKFKVEPTLESGSSITSKSLSSDTESQKYSFTIDSNTVQPYSSGSQPKDEWDDSISVHGYLTLNYTRNPVSGGGGNNILLTNVNGKWVISTG